MFLLSEWRRSGLGRRAAAGPPVACSIVSFAVGRRAASRIVGLVQLAVASGDVVVQIDSWVFLIWYLAHIPCRSVNNRPGAYCGWAYSG